MPESTTDSGIRIRPAIPPEAGTLTALAVRSKAVWGYDAEFMNAAMPDLRVDEANIGAAPIFLAELHMRVAGFYALSRPGTPPELEQFFVEPKYLGLGVGRALWAHALGTAAQLGWTSFRIAADPNAGAFYERMGARLEGAESSIVDPNRRLPVYRAEVRAG